MKGRGELNSWCVVIPVIHPAEGFLVSVYVSFLL